MNLAELLLSKAVTISPVKMRSVVLAYADGLQDMAVVDVSARDNAVSTKTYAPVFSQEDVFCHIVDTIGFIDYDDVGKAIANLLKTGTIVKSAFTVKSMFGEQIPKYYVKASTVTE